MIFLLEPTWNSRAFVRKRSLHWGLVKSAGNAFEESQCIIPFHLPNLSTRFMSVRASMRSATRRSTAIWHGSLTLHCLTLHWGPVVCLMTMSRLRMRAISSIRYRRSIALLGVRATSDYLLILHSRCKVTFFGDGFCASGWLDWPVATRLMSVHAVNRSTSGRKLCAWQEVSK